MFNSGFVLGLLETSMSCGNMHDVYGIVRPHSHWYDSESE